MSIAVASMPSSTVLYMHAIHMPVTSVIPTVQELPDLPELEYHRGFTAS
jgi:hypothetical protein